MTSPFAPPPARLDGGGQAVTVDVETIDAQLRFDVTARAAEASVRMQFVVDGPSGRPAIDLRQDLDSVVLDGVSLEVDALGHVDLGGGPDAQMRVLDRELESGTRHVLELSYRLATPSALGAVPIDWRPDGVRFDLWMSDLAPGRYLEMWLPSPLCHDRFALQLDVTIIGTHRPHVAVTNAGPAPSAGKSWSIRYPATFTSLSPMLVIAPVDEVEYLRRAVTMTGGHQPIDLRMVRHGEVDVDLDASAADVAAWLPYLASRYGPWAHGPAMTTLLWDSTRGMEYDGGTTSSSAALEHEVFHSWFGRGVKPATASDGWIDEAWTSWATASGRREGGRFDVIPFDLDAAAVTLYPPHPWSRFTSRESYREGAQLFAGIASALGGADRLRSHMASWYSANAGQLITTAGLKRHLETASGLDLTPWWDRFVHGRATGS